MAVSGGWQREMFWDFGRNFGWIRGRVAHKMRRQFAMWLSPGQPPYVAEILTEYCKIILQTS